MRRPLKSPPPHAGEAGLASRSGDRSGGGDVKCNTAIMRQRAQRLRREATEAERALWARLRRRQMLGYKFRRQQPLGRYIVDFVCFEKRLIIEVDGSQHLEQQSYDEVRSRWLEQQGYEVLRFWNNKVLAETDAVVDAIVLWLEDGS